VLYLRGVTDNPPQPAYLDTVSIGNCIAMPGDSISLPIIIKTAEPLCGFEINIYYSDRYLKQPRANPNPPFNLWLVRDTTTIILLESNGSLRTGQYLLGHLNFTIADDVPIDTTLYISLIGGSYFPTGLANFSYPTYFISPILVNGAVHIGTNAVDEPDLPGNMSLRCYPNPFNAQITLLYSTSFESPVELTIYDIAGRETARFTNDKMPAGEHSYIWNAAGMSSGVYFCQVRSGNNIISRKIALIK
jgi:hypothetical protein